MMGVLIASLVRGLKDDSADQNWSLDLIQNNEM